jgi:hypothetical protein
MVEKWVIYNISVMGWWNDFRHSERREVGREQELGGRLRKRQPG